VAASWFGAWKKASTHSVSRAQLDGLNCRLSTFLSVATDAAQHLAMMLQELHTGATCNAQRAKFHLLPQMELEEVKEQRERQHEWHSKCWEYLLHLSLQH
jgi:hypothetical protein